LLAVPPELGVPPELDEVLSGLAAAASGFEGASDLDPLLVELGAVPSSFFLEPLLDE
jgi:hypothetical protein